MLLVAAVQGAAPPLRALDPRAEAIARLFPARPSGFVTDAAGVVDEPSRVRMERAAERLRRRTGAEIAVVTLSSIGAYAPVDVAVAIGRAWGVGARAEAGDPRRNAGLVLLLVPRNPADDNSGHVFISTGRGLEGIVTDLQAGRARDVMLPALREGRYGAALALGVDSLAALIGRGMGSTATPADSAPGPSRMPRAATMLLTIVVIVALVSVIAGSRSRRGPPGRGRRRRRRRDSFWDGGFGGWGGGFGGGGFGGFGGGGGFSGGGAGGRF